MTGDAARAKKISGHSNEAEFARLIGGELHAGLATDKPDVIDKNGDAHSVKSGKFWQIFLYGRERFVANTNFNDIGNLCPLFIDCLDTFPGTYEKYAADKHSAKIKLQPAMRALLAEMQRPTVLSRFLQKGLFDGQAVLYLTVSRSIANSAHKHHHIFHRDDAIEVLSKLTLENSRARTAEQYSDLKVLFKTTKNVGEIEVRADSKMHYKQMKWRFNGNLIFEFLHENLPAPKKPNPSIFVYGCAAKHFCI